jgi:hypothetical protein
VTIWKFASYDGCQLTVLDCEDELLDLAAALDIRMFLEAGPSELLDHYDISHVDGSITTAHDVERIRDVRARSGLLVTLGACATAGGIQALRNSADVGQFTSIVYARPDWIETLATSTPSPPTCRSTTSCTAARSASTSCWRRSPRSWPVAGPGVLLVPPLCSWVSSARSTPTPRPSVRRPPATRSPTRHDP